jgi:NitT/TauT family transport system substrate-binding protein
MEAALSSESGSSQSGRGVRYGLAAAVTVAAVLLSACSSSGSSATGTATGASGGGNGQSPTTLTVDAAFWGPVDVPLFYAESQGYFAKQGVDVKFVVASSNTQLASVLGGSVQFASSSPINTVNAAANGAKLVNFMAVEVGYSEDLIMSKPAYQAAGLNASSTTKQKVEALAGKKLGVISATGENGIIFKYLFHWAGIPLSELDMVQLGTPQAIQAALKDGDIAAANVGSPYPQESVADGYAEYLLHAPLSEIPPMSTAITQTLSTTETYYSANQALIGKFIAGYEEGLKATLANPTATATFVAKKYFTDTPLANFMSSFNEDLPIIAKSTAITTAQKNDLKYIAANAGVTVPADWDSFFVQP